MSSRQRTSFAPSPGGGLFVQMDMLAALEAADAVQANADSAVGTNPAWTDTIIRRHFKSRALTDRPLIRLALTALQQAVQDLKDGPASTDFADALDWFNESECLLSADRVFGELEISTRAGREALAWYCKDTVIAAGPLNILKSKDAIDRPVAVLPATSKRSRAEAAAVDAAAASNRANSFARAATNPLHETWGAVVRGRLKRERIDAKAAGLQARQSARMARRKALEPAL